MLPDSHGYGAIGSNSESSSRNTLSDANYQVEALDKFENDLDHLFPERTQHKENVSVTLSHSFLIYCSR